MKKIEARILHRLINGAIINKRQVLKSDNNGVKWIKRNDLRLTIGSQGGEIINALKSLKSKNFIRSRTEAFLKKGKAPEFFSITDRGRAAFDTLNSLFIA